eukprot:3100271-Alexandrium_andersonii.AAC.2
MCTSARTSMCKTIARTTDVTNDRLSAQLGRARRRAPTNRIRSATPLRSQIEVPNADGTTAES